MKYFIDTEFMEDGKTIDLLSVAIVAEDGREFYAEVADANFGKANDWVKENVIPQLWHRQHDKAEFNKWSRDGGRGGLFRYAELAREIQLFVGECACPPKFWGYYADYDWVAFCQLFGKMIDLPKGWPMYCRDIKQLCDFVGNPKLPEQGKGVHHALMDARWNKHAFDFLNTGANFLNFAVQAIQCLLSIQGSSGNWDYNPYMHGMFNGIECALATIEGREANYRNAPEKWLDKSGLMLISAERQRQIDKEGWTPDHDDEHKYGELAYAAMGYAHLAAAQSDAIKLEGEPEDMRPHPNWPFDASWWKPSKDPIRNLEKAGALIAAEIDRLQRAKGKE